MTLLFTICSSADRFDLHYFKVYAVDERNLFIKNFQYDGTGPDAYFWVGDDVQPSPRGMIVPYPPEPTTGVTTGTTASRRGGGSRSTTPSVSYRNRGRKQRGRVTTDDSEVRARAPPGLKKMINENVLLTLPGNYKVTDIRWLAVWCTRFTVNYGEVYIPKKLNIPKSVVRTIANETHIINTTDIHSQ